MLDRLQIMHPRSLILDTSLVFVVWLQLMAVLCSIAPYKKREINNVHMFCVAVCILVVINL